MASAQDRFKLITCVLYRGGGEKVLKALFEKGILATSHYTARGSSIGDQVQKNGLPKQFEKEVVTVVISASQADEIFEFIYDVADINRPHGGILYMEELKTASDYKLPKAPIEFTHDHKEAPTSP